MSVAHTFRASIFALLAAFVLVTFASAKQWTVLGPEGGDVRSLAYDPANPDTIYLGTSTGTLFVSNDGGQNWSRFTQFKNADNYVLDHIVIDPKDPSHIYVAAWSTIDQKAGDVFRSLDGGKTWETLKGMHDKSIRALAMSASDSKILVAGALDGVFRTQDAGESWERISPPSYAELKNIESIAINPKDPNVIYAGTWHLAWKTPDGGANWKRINNGMIDDSDVFSIIVDYANPSTVFASACSGIYKSDSAGDLFHKIQGMPFSARRTRVLRQDPNNPSTVYAGTTEGLWKTTDGGKLWKQMTRPDVVVNDVMIDPRNSKRMMLATDRSGVLASTDAALSFTVSNRGYSHRYVSSIVGSNQGPEVLVGLVNDHDLGGVFESRDGGQHWRQNASGLKGLDVFILKQADDGALLAGTNHGIYQLTSASAAWKPINVVMNEKTVEKTVRKGKKKTTVASKSAPKASISGRVYDIDLLPDRWMIATSQGIFTSTNAGKAWTGGPVLGHTEFLSIDHNKSMIAAATLKEILLSSDNGATWTVSPMPDFVTSIRDLAVTPDSTVVVAAREGVFRSTDQGQVWERVVIGIPPGHITSVSYDHAKERLLATSVLSTTVHESHDGGKTWQAGSDTGYPLNLVAVVHGRLMAATPFDGVIAQPDNESETASSAAASSSASH